jgi:hypothetical protein
MNPIRRISMCVVLAAVAALPLAQVAGAKTQAPDVPGDIQVEKGHKVFLSGHAIGVQIYRCNASSGGFAWGLVAPRANLYGDNGKLIMTHYGARPGRPGTAARSWVRATGRRASTRPPSRGSA